MADFTTLIKKTSVLGGGPKLVASEDLLDELSNFEQGNEKTGFLVVKEGSRTKEASPFGNDPMIVSFLAGEHNQEDLLSFAKKNPEFEIMPVTKGKGDHTGKEVRKFREGKEKYSAKIGGGKIDIIKKAAAPGGSKVKRVGEKGLQFIGTFGGSDAKDFLTGEKNEFHQKLKSHTAKGLTFREIPHSRAKK